MAVLFDAEGNEVTVPDSALEGQEDLRAELTKVRGELERTQATVTRLASRPGLQDEPEQTDAEAAMEAFNAERAKGTPQDTAEATFVHQISQRAITRANRARQSETTAARIERLKQELDAIQADA